MFDPPPPGVGLRQSGYLLLSSLLTEHLFHIKPRE